MICPVCDEGNLTEHYYSETFLFLGKQIEVKNLKHSVCDMCGASPILTDRIIHNQILIKSAKC